MLGLVVVVVVMVVVVVELVELVGGGGVALCRQACASAGPRGPWRVVDVATQPSMRLLFATSVVVVVVIIVVVVTIVVVVFVPWAMLLGVVETRLHA